MKKEIVLGLDIGGTNTRVLVTDIYGNFINYLESIDMRERNKVQQTIKNAVLDSGHSLQDIVALGAGIAGVPYCNEANDQLTFDEGYNMVNLPGLSYPFSIKNDAVVAYKGAFPDNEYGIVVIAGTGSAIYAVSETQVLPPTPFGAGAGNIAQNVMKDDPIKYDPYNPTSNMIASQLVMFIAPMVTAAAKSGNLTALQICNDISLRILRTVESAKDMFTTFPVPIALIGSVANDATIKKFVEENIENQNFKILDDIYPPIIGAIFEAMKTAGIETTEVIRENLRKTSYQCK